MVAVAAIFIHYLLTPTRRSRRQVMLLVYREPLRIRNRTITVHFVYVYVLLIRPTYLYTYTFTVSAVTIAPITAITAITLIHKPILFTIVVFLYLPSYLLSVYIYRILAAFYLRGETRGTLFRRSWTLIYVYIYLYVLRILVVVDFRGEAGGTLLCSGCPPYICILAVAVVRSSSAVRS